MPTSQNSPLGLRSPVSVRRDLQRSEGICLLTMLRLPLQENRRFSIQGSGRCQVSQTARAVTHHDAGRGSESACDCSSWQSRGGSKCSKLDMIVKRIKRKSMCERAIRSTRRRRRRCRIDRGKSATKRGVGGVPVEQLPALPMLYSPWTFLRSL